MDGLTLFGLTAVTAFYALEDRHPRCLLGFLQGAWPFGLVEAVWALVALRRARRAR